MKSGTDRSDGERLVVYEYWPKGIPVVTPMNSQMNDIVAAIMKNLDAVFRFRFAYEWKK